MVSNIDIAAAGDRCVITNDLGIHAEGVAGAVERNMGGWGENGPGKFRTIISRDREVGFIGRRDVDQVIEQLRWEIVISAADGMDRGGGTAVERNITIGDKEEYAFAIGIMNAIAVYIARDLPVAIQA